MINRFIKRLFRQCGLELFRRETMPRGLLLNVDLSRIFHGKGPARIFDVGANIGQTSLRLHEAFPQAQIHAFEPVPQTFEILRANIAHLPQVLPHCSALGECDGKAVMTRAENTEWNRIIESNTPEPSGQEVDIFRLESFCRTHGILPPDFLKTDCEGHDLHVVKGAGSFLTDGTIRAIYCEVNFRRDGVQADFYQLEEFLSKAGYIVYGFYDYSGWNYPISYDGFTNALFVHRSVWE